MITVQEILNLVDSLGYEKPNFKLVIKLSELSFEYEDNYLKMSKAYKDGDKKLHMKFVRREIVLNRETNKLRDRLGIRVKPNANKTKFKSKMSYTVARVQNLFC